MNDLVSEYQGMQNTGTITLRAGVLPATNFELRALRDIDVGLSKTSGTSDLTLSGFMGGLQGFDPANNVSINVTGTLTVLGGIVAANASAGGDIDVTAASVTIDGASVFIADQLKVSTSGGMLLNTVVTSVEAHSTGSGNITINESDGLLIESVTARDGSIAIRTGGDTRISNILLWQLAYTELWFTEALSPDFDAGQLQQALDAQQRGTRMIMQVHDELVFEVPQSEVDWVRTEVPRLMAGVAQLRVPLRAEIGVGENWDQAH
jgi:hypothetical protein